MKSKIVIVQLKLNYDINKKLSLDIKPSEKRYLQSYILSFWDFTGFQVKGAFIWHIFIWDLKCSEDIMPPVYLCELLLSGLHQIEIFLIWFSTNAFLNWHVTWLSKQPTSWSTGLQSVKIWNTMWLCVHSKLACVRQLKNLLAN